ncbi:MAG: hypothetical protein MZU95_03575 [Desulfomicrobium escambiense]|nr:hypothetical protein [Desulfomicrobium escambiense]
MVGYDMTRLLVGSEGTLGVITKLIVRLIPHPADVTTLVALFPKLSPAMEAITTILMARLHALHAMEFMDRTVPGAGRRPPPFRRVSGGRGDAPDRDRTAPRRSIRREIEAIREICLARRSKRCPDRPGCRQAEADVGRAPGDIAPDRGALTLWTSRRTSSFRWGGSPSSSSGLPEYEAAYGVKIYAFGHAGDGNIHLSVTAETSDARESADGGGPRDHPEGDRHGGNDVRRTRRRDRQAALPAARTLAGEHPPPAGDQAPLRPEPHPEPRKDLRLRKEKRDPFGDDQKYLGLLRFFMSLRKVISPEPNEPMINTDIKYKGGD